VLHATVFRNGGGVACGVRTTPGSAAWPKIYRRQRATLNEGRKEAGRYGQLHRCVRISRLQVATGTTPATQGGIWPIKFNFLTLAIVGLDCSSIFELSLLKIPVPVCSGIPKQTKKIPVPVRSGLPERLLVPVRFRFRLKNHVPVAY